MDRQATAAGFCRDCGTPVPQEAKRCPSCRGPRLIRHKELFTLSIAHLDCDAFYAAVEKRDNPELRDKPVIIGGGTRGVVSTACYIARIHGVKSAMPMFKAMALCPEAVVVRPDMAKYAKAGQEVRQLMQSLTPLVEPLSIDEAFMDLTGTEKLHAMSPAESLAALARRVEAEIGITVSIGLSHNKFLAKLASDLDKPRGFSVIGKEETLPFLAARPVSSIWGVGKAMEAELAKDAITTIAQLQRMDKIDLMRKYGQMGAHLWHLARGEDARKVTPDQEAKSIGAETTFNTDISDPEELERLLWQMAEKASRRAKADGMAASTITLKLKTADFKQLSRAASLSAPTQLAWRIFQAAAPLLKREATGRKFRLIGVSLSNLSLAEMDEEQGLDASYVRHAKAEKAMDDLRARFGRDAVTAGRVFTGREKEDGSEDQ